MGNLDYKKLFDLTGKTAIVTGAGAGLGKEIARALAQFGANVVIADINGGLAHATARELRKHHVQTIAVKIDVSKEAEIIRLVEQTVETFGKIDILVNNAGIMQKVNLEDMSLADWQHIMDVNLNSVFLMSKYVGRDMIAKGGGSIINTASISSFVSNKEPQCAYNTSKAGVLMITKCLASEWAKHNIRVNAIAPGYTRTTMTEAAFANDENLVEIHKLIPMARVAEPSEAASLVVLLASDASSYTTGSVIHADGGYTIW